jgi:uncharacterized protein involved in exopolysaccharide biosynthesis
MQQIKDKYYDEINLREIIEILLSGRRLIAMITAICLLVSGILSFFILEPSYEAKTILMASFATERLNTLRNNTEDKAGILDLLAVDPIMTIQTYKEQIRNTHLLQQVIDELQLGKYDINVDDLIEMIGLTTIPDTNLISVSVTNKDPKLATNIANTLTKKFTGFITEISRQQASKSSQFITGQLEVEKRKLDEATLELKEFVSQPKGVEELKEEFKSKVLMLTDYKTKLIEKEIELSKVKAGLAVAEKELINTPQVIVTKKSVGKDPLLNQILAETKGISTGNAAQLTMESEEVNQGYIALKSRISEFKIRTSEISSELYMTRIKIDITQKELENIQRELADKEHNQTLIQGKVDLSQEIYDAFLNKYEEIRIAESTEIGDSTITIISEAVIPELPTGPNKILNIAIAGVLGIMIGGFVVIFREYWQMSGKRVAGKEMTNTL